MKSKKGINITSPILMIILAIVVLMIIVPNLYAGVKALIPFGWGSDKKDNPGQVGPELTDGEKQVKQLNEISKKFIELKTEYETMNVPATSKNPCVIGSFEDQKVPSGNIPAWSKMIIKGDKLFFVDINDKEIGSTQKKIQKSDFLLYNTPQDLKNTKSVIHPSKIEITSDGITIYELSTDGAEVKIASMPSLNTVEGRLGLSYYNNGRYWTLDYYPPYKDQC